VTTVVVLDGNSYARCPKCKRPVPFFGGEQDALHSDIKRFASDALITMECWIRGRFDVQGMWLPETAVDTETFEVLTEHEVKFTILAPRQASRIRRFGSRSWKDVSGAKIDPSRAYVARLPSRRSIVLFFYDGPISQAVAGRSFVERLLTGFSEPRTWPQICHIATDGKSYGHHHAFGEMALDYELQQIESEKLRRAH
jgi:hypothetical protein